MNELNMEQFFEDYNNFYAFQMTFVSEFQNFKEIKNAINNRKPRNSSTPK